MYADFYPNKSVRSVIPPWMIHNPYVILSRIHFVKYITPGSMYGIPKCNLSCLTICHYLIFEPYIRNYLAAWYSTAVEIKISSHALLTPWVLFLNVSFIEEIFSLAITSASVTNHPMSSHGPRYKPNTTLLRYGWGYTLQRKADTSGQWGTFIFQIKVCFTRFRKRMYKILWTWSSVIDKIFIMEISKDALSKDVTWNAKKQETTV